MPDLLHEVRDGVAYLGFNRPEVNNAFTDDMYERLYELCDEIDADPAVRMVVLRGVGGKAFVAGSDINGFKRIRSGEDGVAYAERTGRAFERVERLRVPTVAVIEGYAVGGGLFLACACDIRLCTPEAKLGVPVARTLGNSASIKNYARLTRLAGLGTVKEMLLTARLFSAEEAAAAGLVNHIVEPEQVDDKVSEIAARVRGNSPMTMQAAKEALRRLQPCVPSDHDLLTEVYGGSEFQEGVSAFLEKRSPIWRAE